MTYIQQILVNSKWDRIRTNDSSSPGDGNRSEIYKFRIEHEDGLFLLKKYVSPHSFPKRLDLIQTLNDSCKSQTLAYQNVFYVEGAPCLLFNFIVGEKLTSLDSSQAQDLGRMLRQFHDVSGLIHGDFHLGNVIYNSQPYLIDVDTVAEGTSYKDFGRFFFHDLAKNRESHVSTCMPHFFRGYGIIPKLQPLKKQIDDSIKTARIVSDQERNVGLITQTEYERRFRIFKEVETQYFEKIVKTLNL